LEVLKAAEVDDRIRQVAETIYQAVTEAELTAAIGAHPHQHKRRPSNDAERRLFARAR
jgi:transposase-like protein